MLKSLKEVVAGDIILTRDNNFLSKMIRKFEGLQTGDAQYSHSAAAVSDYLCVEALWRTRINCISKYEKTALEVWRVPITPLERGDFERGMLQIAGQDYGIAMIPLFALDCVASTVVRLFGRKKPVYFFTERFGLFNLPVCSQLVMFGIEKFTNYTIRNENHERVSWKVISPDMLQDLLSLPHNKAELIYKQEAK